MSQIEYKIESVNGKDGSKKVNTYGDKNLFIKFLVVGQGAILVDLKSKERKNTIYTSTVEKIMIFENNIEITTLNSVYYLEPVRSEDK